MFWQQQQDAMHQALLMLPPALASRLQAGCCHGTTWTGSITDGIIVDAPPADRLLSGDSFTWSEAEQVKRDLGISLGVMPGSTFAVKGQLHIKSKADRHLQAGTALGGKQNDAAAAMHHVKGLRLVIHSPAGSACWTYLKASNQALTPASYSVRLPVSQLQSTALPKPCSHILEVPLLRWLTCLGMCLQLSGYAATASMQQW